MRPWLAYDAAILVVVIVAVLLLTFRFWYPPLARFVQGTKQDIEDATRGGERENK